MKNKNKDKNENHSLLLKLGMIFITSVLLSSCASEPLKAPCNQYASFCGTKTKINHW